MENFIFCAVLVTKFYHISFYEITKNYNTENCICKTEIFHSKEAAHGKASIKGKPSENVIQQLLHQKKSF